MPKKVDIGVDIGIKNEKITPLRKKIKRTGFAIIVWAILATIVHIFGRDPISDLYTIDLPLAIIGIVTVYSSRMF